ncbi:MAG: hypothetical protein WDA13_03500 [Candidatus Shapirobacteria bacterium]
MERKCFFPYQYYKENKPLIFLAGPIIGAPNWQQQAINIIHCKNPEIAIASPKHLEKKQTNFSLEEQSDWESFHLTKASENGAIIFWLAKEIEHRCERPYAQTSRFELGEWKTKQQNKETFLSVGIEDGFTNSNYIKRRLSQDCPNVPIFRDLKETCNFAIDICIP